MWRVPRTLCEKYKIKYPTIVYGTVEQVQFTELAATFEIITDLVDSVLLPLELEVPLVDLWVTKKQSNSAVNARDTANCIDVLRYKCADKSAMAPWH